MQMNVMMKTIFGSNLYGLATPESDKDYKGIFIPTAREIVLGGRDTYNTSTGGKHKNGAEDVDTEMMSLRQFIRLASKGETMCIDMLHARPEHLVSTTGLWDFVHDHREMFYTTKMDAFLGYCRKQASKYGVKGSRLAALERVMVFCKSVPQANWDYKLRNFIEFMPKDEFTFSGTDTTKSGDEISFYEVLGRRYLYGIKFSEFASQVSKIYEDYGDRAKKAKEQVGVDWKALSHAVRGGEQLLEIYQTGDLQFPLKNRQFILDVKLGKKSLVDEVQPYLEDLTDRVEAEIKIATANGMRSHVDVEYWNQFVYDVYSDEVRK